MMKKLLLLILILPVFISSQTNLVKWFNSNFTPTYLENHILVSDISTSGVKITNEVWGADNVFYSAGEWPAGKKIDVYKYIQFKVSPDNGYKIEMDAFVFNGRTQGNDPFMQVRFSKDEQFITYNTLQPEFKVSSNYFIYNLKFPAQTVVNSGENLYIRIYIYNTNNHFHLQHNLSGTVAPSIWGNVSLEKPVKPVVNDDRAGTMKKTAVSIDVLSNDTYKFSGSLSEISIVGAARNGKVVINGLSDITYTPIDNFVGYDSFYYTATNAIGVSNTAKVEIQVIDSTLEDHKPLVRWNKMDFTAKNYNPKSIIGSSLNLSFNKISATKDSFVLNNLPTPLEFNGTLDPKKYLEMSVEAFDGVTALNLFTMRYRSTGEGNMTIKYSKSEDFTGPVYTFKEADKLRYTGKEASVVASFPAGTILYPGEKIYIRIYIYNTNQPTFIVDFSQNGEVGPALIGVVDKLIKNAVPTWDGMKWEGGLLPDAKKRVIIIGNYDTSINGSFDALNLTVSNSAILRVGTDTFITINDEVVINPGSTLLVENDGNLIQMNNQAKNVGNVTVRRKVLGVKNSFDKYKHMDYIYWSSPVEGNNLKTFSPGTPMNRIYQYNETNDQFKTVNFISEPTFVAGKGYAFRAEDGLVYNYDKTYEFTGIPHNGIKTIGVQRSPNKDGLEHGYNMIGNPYPSNIDFKVLHKQNKNTISKTAWFWVNDEAIRYQTGSGYAGNGYAFFNGTGGTPATGRNVKPNGIIKVGQGFMVQMIDPLKKGSINTGAVIFNNSMRVSATGNFFNKNETQINRFWLKLTSPQGVENTLLVGYLQDATNGFDQDYDAEAFGLSSDLFYSVLESKQLIIQGKGEFTTEDKVILGGNLFSTGDYTISLETAEGLFADGQQIYLKDKVLNTYTDLQTISYTFVAEAGITEGRFEIVYRPENNLTTGNVNKDQILVYKNANDFMVETIKNMRAVEVYDAVGRLINKNSTASKKITLSSDSWAAGLYLLKINFADGSSQNKKVIK